MVEYILDERRRRGLLQIALCDLRAGGPRHVCERLGPQTVKTVVDARADAHFEFQQRAGNDIHAQSVLDILPRKALRRVRHEQRRVCITVQDRMAAVVRGGGIFLR